MRKQERQGPAHDGNGSVTAMATFQHVAPILPTADLNAMRAHYEALGFTVAVHGGGYGTAARDGIRIHFKHVPDLAPWPAGTER